MRLDATPPMGAAINDIDAINAVITNPAVYGEAGRIVSVQDRLVVSMPGLVVGFRIVRDRVHECHQAVLPAWRGRRAMRAMRDIREWWWATQPSDLLIGAIPDTCRPARFVMHALGFARCGLIDAPDRDGVVRSHAIYQMERPA